MISKNRINLRYYLIGLLAGLSWLGFLDVLQFSGSKIFEHFWFDIAFYPTLWFVTCLVQSWWIKRKAKQCVNCECQHESNS